MKQKNETPDIICHRVHGKLSHATFTIKPIREFVLRYVGDGKGWIDPFAGNNSPAELTNDHNPDRKTLFHTEAQVFVQSSLIGKDYAGALFDPPYSYRQVSEHYKRMGQKATALDTSYRFYRRVLVPLSKRIKMGGFALSFGWNTNGFGKSLGFEKREILVVGHGGHHNDTLCLAEQKVREV